LPALPTDCESFIFILVSMTTELVWLHYNDVYTIEPSNFKPGDENAVAGGAARFATLVKRFAAEDPLVLFSGDAFNPSAMSTVTKGKHMVPVLNELGTTISVMGNVSEERIPRE
jgi:5'-nucleotidase